MIEVSIQDGITPFIQAALDARPTLRARISRAVAWYTQKRIKALANDSKVTGRYPKRADYRIVRRPLAGEKTPPANVWWGKLRRAIGYQFDGRYALLGWTSRASAMEGDIQEAGNTRAVTPRIQAYYAKIRDTVSPELRVPTKPNIELPARPLYVPAMIVIQPEYKEFVAKKMAEYMAGIVHNGIRRSSRKYKVWQ